MQENLEKENKIQSVGLDANPEIKAAIKRIFMTPDGKILFKYLAAKTGLLKSSISLTGQDRNVSVEHTLINEAKKSVFLDILKVIDFKVDLDFNIKQ